MITRSQKRKAVEELVSQDLETTVAGNNQVESFVAGPRKAPRVHLETLDEIKTPLR